MRHEFKLRDVFDREIGHVSKTWDVDGGLGGRFEPGPDFDQVAGLFERYEECVTSGAPSDDAMSVYEELIKLKPRLVSEVDGDESSYHAAVISQTPKGYLLTLIHNAAEDLLATHPIRGETSGWFFRLEEVSASAWRVEGTDCLGRKVVLEGLDERELLARAEERARQINDGLDAT